MRTRNLIFLTLLVALIFVSVPSVFAASEEYLCTKLGLEYWDIWLHSDGETWQYTGAPGDTKSETFSPSRPSFPDHENLRYVMYAGISEGDFKTAGGRSGYPPNDEGWKNFSDKFLKHIPDGYYKSGSNKVTFTLSPKSEAVNLKEDDQDELVEGWRWYLPVTIDWYGTPKATVDFDVVSLQPGCTESVYGKTYLGTAAFRLKSDSRQAEYANVTVTQNGTKVIDERNVYFPIGHTQEYSFWWSGIADDSSFKAEIWPCNEEDMNPSDNTKTAFVPRASHSLEIAVTPGVHGGTTSPRPGKHTYKSGDLVSVTATPCQYWEFKQWSGDVSSVNLQMSIRMDGSKFVLAEFYQPALPGPGPDDGKGTGRPRPVK